MSGSSRRPAAVRRVAAMAAIVIVVAVLATTLVVIPMRNEAATIEAVIEGVRRHGVDLLVVDDGSTDAGANLARTAGAEATPSATDSLPARAS